MLAFQIAVHEKNAQDNWIKARILEREIVEQSRGAAHLKYRLEIMPKKRLPEGYRRHKPISGRPGMQNPAQRDAAPGSAAPRKDSGSRPPEQAAAAAQQQAAGKRNVEARGPPPFEGPSGMASFMGLPFVSTHRLWATSTSSTPVASRTSPSTCTCSPRFRIVSGEKSDKNPETREMRSAGT
ncbi:transport and Golgi organization protein 1 homolog [Equus przewalskii]|uniref:Transport and Golgi organization protein 1 homolog n=1 Tax=Equus przewalskii TaxID=9798 RepID=A0ABM4KA08_EQUPR